MSLVSGCDAALFVKVFGLPAALLIGFINGKVVHVHVVLDISRLEGADDLALDPYFFCSLIIINSFKSDLVFIVDDFIQVTGDWFLLLIFRHARAWLGGRGCRFETFHDLYGTQVVVGRKYPLTYLNLIEVLLDLDLPINRR